MAEKDSYTNDNKRPTSASVDWFYCSHCDKTLPQDEKTEHEDWHLAQKLQDEDQAASMASQGPPASRVAVAPTGQPQWTATTNQTFVTYPSGYTGIESSSDHFRPSHHVNAFSHACDIRARDEQEMQNALQSLQMQYRIYNPEIEPEHDFDGWCYCPIHEYMRLKMNRYGVQEMWCRAVLYPGEKRYMDFNTIQAYSVWSNNPYNRQNVCSPYGYNNGWMPPTRPIPQYHEKFILQTMRLNQQLNEAAQRKIDSREPIANIWADHSLESSMSGLSIVEYSDKKEKDSGKRDSKSQNSAPLPPKSGKSSKPSKFSSFKKSLGIKSAEEKDTELGAALKYDILTEEAGRWPDPQWRELVYSYQDKIGIRQKVALLRDRYPIQYIHLLRAGYFEPIPVAWANLVSNPLKFSIEAASGWPGITPAWRGYEDTAEERLYWVLNHRYGSNGARLKPDFVSVMQMALARMASAVEPPPEYYSPDDTCHLQHTSEGYSKQVMPPPFVPHDRPEVATDDTMILLDISGSMDFDPMRPIYDRYLVMDYFKTTQPKNKDAARAIVKRFTDAMINHDANSRGYDLITFSSHAHHLGTINHKNFAQLWSTIHFGGGTRVMTGWQRVKDLHFQKHSESAIHHPVYGWQAGPQTPILRLLLLLDGEATDMDEFELDLLGLSWAHVTIFLIGVDGCPHHHRHANELQRISDVNPHVAFVDAQGNMPERFVTHELLKRHLGRQISLEEFQGLEVLPAYSEV